MAINGLPIKVVLYAYFVVFLCLFFPHPTTALGGEEGGGVPVPVPARHGAVVKKDQRWSVISTEFGEISAVKMSDGRVGSYHLQFITMEPNSLFLPVHLHSDMVFYVDSGSGTLSWTDLEKDDNKLRQVQLQAGDVYRLPMGSFFYLQSSLEPERRKFRIYAIFSDSKEELREGPSFGAYASVRDLVLGFDNKVLQAALNVEEGVIDELKSGERQPLIVHGVAEAKNSLWEVHYRIMRAFLGRTNNGMLDVNKNKKKAYNILKAKHDIVNCNGWSLIVTSKQFDALKDSNFGIFLVNLTKGAMMGPHWNPTTAEIAVVLNGRGMVHVVCPSAANETGCKNSRFRVEEGDVFVVPRYHPMAQMSFNNGSLVFMGFTTTTKKNHPQYLAGKASVLQTLEKWVVATSFNMSNTTVDQVLSAQRDEIILECTSCAEEEERLMEEEIGREEEERRRKEEEEARKREEEARREEEEARKKEEEEARRREEERRKKEEEEEEEARRQEEEEAARREQEEAQKREEERRKEEEETARRQEEERARKEEEEEARRKEEEAARREQEEAQKREEEEEAASRQEEERARKEEQEEARRKEEEEAVRREQEEAQKREEERRQEEEEARRQEEARRTQQEEEAARRQEEEAARRQEEEAARRQEEEAAKRQQEEEEAAARRQQEEEEAAARRQQEEEAAARRQEEEARRRQQEEEEAARQRQREEEEAGQGGGGQEPRGEGEAARREEEEMRRRQQEEEAAARAREAERRGGGGGDEGHEE